MLVLSMLNYHMLVYHVQVRSITIGIMASFSQRVVVKRGGDVQRGKHALYNNYIGGLRSWKSLSLEGSIDRFIMKLEVASISTQHQNELTDTV